MLTWAAVALAGGALLAHRRVAFEDLPQAELSGLYGDPQEYLGQTLRIQVQVEGELTQWNPFLTRFGERDYRALRCWSDSQFLWQPEDWDAPLALLFARRGSEAEAALAKLPKFTHCEALVCVRQVFMGRPWLEVRSLVALGDSIQEGSILHASRALRWAEERRWSAAVDDFERALVGPMPEAARRELRRLRDVARGELDSSSSSSR